MLATAAFAAGAAAEGMVQVINQCDKPVYLVTVHNDAGGEELGKFEKEENWATTYEDGTREVKVSSDGDAYEVGASQTSLAYNVHDGRVIFDLYNIFGTEFDSLVVETKGGDDDKCEGIFWEDGEKPEGSQSRECSSDTDITLTICGGKGDKDGEKEE